MSTQIVFVEPTNYLIHPVVKNYRKMSSNDYSDFVEDIRKNGQKVPIVLWNGYLIDGLHRLAACNTIGLNPITITVEMPDSELESYVDSLNGYRRHLTVDQLKEIKNRSAYKIAMETQDNKHGGNRRSVQDPQRGLEKSLTISDLEKGAGIRKGTVSKVKKINSYLALKLEANPGDVETQRDLQLLELGKLDLSYRIEKINQDSNLVKSLSEAEQLASDYLAKYASWGDFDDYYSKNAKAGTKYTRDEVIKLLIDKIGSYQEYLFYSEALPNVSRRLEQSLSDIQWVINRLESENIGVSSKSISALTQIMDLCNKINLTSERLVNYPAAKDSGACS